MNIKITSPDERATVRLTGYKGSYVLRTTFSPWGQKRFVDALDKKYHVERIRVIDVDENEGKEWAGEFELRVEKEEQRTTLIEDIAELMAENLVTVWV